MKLSHFLLSFFKSLCHCVAYLQLIQKTMLFIQWPFKKRFIYGCYLSIQYLTQGRELQNTSNLKVKKSSFLYQFILLINLHRKTV